MKFVFHQILPIAGVAAAALMRKKTKCRPGKTVVLIAATHVACEYLKPAGTLSPGIGFDCKKCSPQQRKLINTTVTGAAVGAMWLGPLALLRKMPAWLAPVVAGGAVAGLHVGIDSCLTKFVAKTEAARAEAEAAANNQPTAEATTH